MKREKFATFLVGFLMACLLSFGAMGTMITGLFLPVEYMDELYRAWVICALAGCVLYLFKKGWIVVLVITVFGLIWLLPEYAFTLPVRALITRLSAIYDSAYDWGILEFAGVEWKKVPLDLPLACWGCLTALSAAGTVMRGRGLFLTLLLSLLPAASTVVVTNTVPDAPYLYMLMLGVILLLLTATVRRHSPHQGAKLTAMTALPIALLLGLLFHSYPKDTYVNRSEEYLNNVVSWWQSTVSVSFDNTGLVDQTPVGPNTSATANLSRVGPRNTWAYTVMVVEADFSDTVYLRGQDFDSYDGTSWAATADRAESFGLSFNWEYDGSITVRTTPAAPANVLYLPYYPTEEQSLSGGRMENEELLREYTYNVRSLRGSSSEFQNMNIPSGDVGDSYTDLPAATLEWASAYLDEHLPGLTETTWVPNGAGDVYYASEKSSAEIARTIAAHVRNSALYDTNTQRMSGEYDDFAQWFLEESDTGYCVHFASATTVLLRAAGIPARYVTGYMFTTEAGETVEVTADQAHAWVEYYHEALGAWVVLESTPADLREEETEPPETEPEATEPPTEAPTEEEAQTRPDGTRPGDQDDPKIDLTWLRTALKWLLIPVGIWLAVLLRYALRRSYRRRKARGPNALALLRWQEVEVLCRVTKQEPPADLENLAQKAKFSQHTLTAEELQIFHTWLREERNKLKQKPWYVRFVCRYVLVLW